MKLVGYLAEFVVVFGLVVVSHATVVYVWNLAVHGEGAFDWARTVVLAIVLGIFLPVWNRFWRRRRHKNR